MARAGAKFAIVKLSEGTGYQNPKAQAQISSAKANNMLTMGYHYAHFGADINRAVQEVTIQLIQQNMLDCQQVLTWLVIGK
uniref:GH25 family lysozyme n=1 Tax=Klebsiella quasipneumoniae TaxID=1463165 RepID=UPI00387ADD1A